MIKLKNIRMNSHIIICDIYPEDSCNKGYLEVNKSTGETLKYLLPEGYEYCKNHIIHAANELINLSKNKTMPTEKVVMWY